MEDITRSNYGRPPGLCECEASGSGRAASLAVNLFIITSRRAIYTSEGGYKVSGHTTLNFDLTHRCGAGIKYMLVVFAHLRVGYRVEHDNCSNKYTYDNLYC